MGMKRFATWLAAVGVLIVVFSTIYAVVQQAERGGANSPQIQLAEDTATALDGGIKPANMLSGRVDMQSSLAPFVIIYDRQGNLVAGSGYLGNAIPTAPYGVLTNADGQPYHTVTWVPKDGVRIAAVSVASKQYYVLSGRNLREVERSETKAFNVAFFGGVAALVPLTAIFWMDEILKRAKPYLAKFA